MRESEREGWPCFFPWIYSRKGSRTVACVLLIVAAYPPHVPRVVPIRALLLRLRLSRGSKIIGKECSGVSFGSGFCVCTRALFRVHFVLFLIRAIDLACERNCGLHLIFINPADALFFRFYAKILKMLIWDGKRFGRHSVIGRNPSTFSLDSVKWREITEQIFVLTGRYKNNIFCHQYLIRLTQFYIFEVLENCVSQFKSVR